MTIIGTSNQYPFSWLIRKITGEEISHVAIVFDDLLVFHSTPKGTGTDWFSDFLEKNKVHKRIPLPLGLASEEKVFFTIIVRRKKKKYDWLAVLYQGYTRLRRKLFRTSIPLENAWADDNKDFCLEVLQSIDWENIKPGLQSKFDALRLDMMTPGEALAAIQLLLGGTDGNYS